MPVMISYRKKPEVVKAVQFDYSESLSYEEAVYWWQFGNVYLCRSLDEYGSWIELKVETPSGKTSVKKGDWITEDVEGNRNVYTDLLFRKTYEPVP